MYVLLRFSKTRKFWSSKANLRLRFFAAVNHLSVPLKKEQFTSTSSKFHGLWLVDFDPFCEFLCIKVPCLGTTRTKISACKPNEKLSHPLGSSWYWDLPPSIQTDPKLTCSGNLYIYWQHYNCLVNNRRRIFQESKKKKVNVVGNWTTSCFFIHRSIESNKITILPERVFSSLINLQEL